MTTIDRKALVSRHNVTMTKLDPLSPLSVGNGEFAFTVDLTGLQTFPKAHESGMPLNTMAQWAWHSFPNAKGYTIADVTEMYRVGDREVPYLAKGGMSGERIPAAEYLRANPHKISLAQIGFAFPDGTTLESLGDMKQTLDLWSGVIHSQYTLLGQTVRVTTVAHPTLDAIAVRVESPLVKDGKLAISFAFPGAKPDWRKMNDWDSVTAHTTTWTPEKTSCMFRRQQDEDVSFARASWNDGANVVHTKPHHYQLHGAEWFVIQFSPRSIQEASPNFNQVLSASQQHWEHFWTHGGAIDLSGTDDPRARELERRIVLSQYQTAINSAGSIPPQETGLVTNSWFGKPHLEMHFWHAAHFATWNRPELLERSLGWYEKILPIAIANAQRQGYTGARWTKMVGPDGVDSPSDVAVFLIWQQPHPIYFAELIHRIRPTRETLDRYAKVIHETAEFMASYARWDEATHRYVLGPALIPAQETYSNIRARLINPTYELAYWHWGLGTAQRWRERMGQPRVAMWDQVIDHLSKPTVRDGVYEAIEAEPFTTPTDHPSMLQAYGNLPPTPLIDRDTMHRTLQKVLKTWEWETTWGWDYPVLAQCAARLGEPEIAVNALLMDVQKNTYLANGHNYQAERLPLYLPGNGGLLLAAGMMAGGWDDGPKENAPGFPSTWNVRVEAMHPLL